LLELSAMEFDKALSRALLGAAMRPLPLYFPDWTAGSCHLTHLHDPPLGWRCPGFLG